MEAARAAKVKELRKDLRKWAGSPHEAAHKDELLASIAALKTIGGVGAARGVMDAFPSTDEDVRDKAFELVELVHDKALLAPLAEHIEHKDFRRDFDLHKRIAHALAVIADPAAIEHLTKLVQSPDADVVAAAADALAVFGDAKTDEKREAVQRLVDLYESTWNLMNSVRPEDRVAAKIAFDKWEIFSKPVRHALQTLTKQQITQSKDWRRWWNDHKKDAEWKPERAPAGPAR
jgi:HEAT repeat protein